ncbi:hypothetical protein [Flavobacterium psychrophilum]|nr:hypothetical protein [Flavobacterium psychrophilum]
MLYIRNLTSGKQEYFVFRIFFFILIPLIIAGFTIFEMYLLTNDSIGYSSKHIYEGYGDTIAIIYDSCCYTNNKKMLLVQYLKQLGATGNPKYIVKH